MGNVHAHVQQLAEQQQQQLSAEGSGGEGTQRCSGSGSGTADARQLLESSSNSLSGAEANSSAEMHRSSSRGRSSPGGLHQQGGRLSFRLSNSSSQATAAATPHSSYPAGRSASGSKDVSQYTGTTMYRRLERERVQLEADAFDGLVFILPVEYQTKSNSTAAAGGGTATEAVSTQSSSPSAAENSQQTFSPEASTAASTAAAGAVPDVAAAGAAARDKDPACTSSSPPSATSSRSSSSSTRERVLRALPASVCNYSITGDAAHDGFTWLLALEGAANTIYEGEVFLLKFNFSPKYPIEAPEVTFLLPYLPQHPHVYSNGHICLSILYDFWSPALSVSSCGMSLLSMLSSNRCKSRPPDDDIYCRLWTSRSPKQVKWIFHDDQV